MRSPSFFHSLGLLSLLAYLAIWGISLQFNWGEGYADRPILAYLGFYFTLFALYALACRIVLKSGANEKPRFLTLLVYGLLFRAALFPAQQIQEDDVYRYLWDAKVFASGINPYKYSPDEVKHFTEFRIRHPIAFRNQYPDPGPQELERLNDLRWSNQRALVYFDRINHPDVPTIYPPLAQFVFGAVHRVSPDNIFAMRTAFFIFDMVALAFIVFTLDAMGKDRRFAVIYLWNPLIIKEIFNSTHLDIIGIALLCGTVYFLYVNQYAAAVLSAALSFLGKLYPVILLPLILKQSLRPPPSPDGEGEPSRAGRNSIGKPLGLAGLFAAVALAGYFPFMDEGWKIFAGLNSYATYWESNDSIFALLVLFFEKGLGFKPEMVLFGQYSLPPTAAKVTVMSILGATLAVYLFRSPPPVDSERVLRQAFVLMALVFLLSPVQNPWYLCWIVPFLCLFPWRAWILLTGLVGLYYLKFYFMYQRMDEWSRWIPWFEYLPFYLYLAFEVWQNRERRDHIEIS
ncbi:MAG: hypothetical protein COV67_14925 [Nitrospinae bacterium CG11_big_fil_rev_8_21_14_0_20_56_8]|nr:MAG: hypothetical protein COV67_14925 [Nitrospinae bacterium CG11_big_fil_rev_8_21_14_0_20_56_8]